MNITNLKSKLCVLFYRENFWAQLWCHNFDVIDYE